MIPEVTAEAMNKFLKGLYSGEFSIMDVANHVDRENKLLKEVLARFALMKLNEEKEVKEGFDVRSFTEGILLTYGAIQYQQAMNNNKDPGFVRPEKWWDGSEWFHD